MSTPDWLSRMEDLFSKDGHDSCLITYYPEDAAAIVRCIRVARAACEYVEEWNYDGHDDPATYSKFLALLGCIEGEDA